MVNREQYETILLLQQELAHLKSQQARPQRRQSGPKPRYNKNQFLALYHDGNWIKGEVLVVRREKREYLLQYVDYIRSSFQNGLFFANESICVQTVVKFGDSTRIDDLQNRDITKLPLVVDYLY